jgi:hypothetical protein
LDLKAHADDAVGMREHREEPIIVAAPSTETQSCGGEGETGDEEEIDLG